MPPAPPAPQALVPVGSEQIPDFIDDADTASLRTAALQSLSYYQRLPPDQRFGLGADGFTARDLAGSMQQLIDLLDQGLAPEALGRAVRDQFQVYQSTGRDGARTVTFSSYYEPTIEARLHADRTFRYPIYGRPNDLIDVDLGLFNPSLQGQRITGRKSGKTLVPYLTRKEIDSAQKLGQQGLEIAYAKDPTEVFFLQVEGSGWLDLGGGVSRRIRYDGDNGRPYQSVGLHLIKSGRVPAAGFGHEAFHRYMSSHASERQSLLNVNERYIFFRLDPSSSSVYAYGNIEVPLTPGRSIATDPKLFPKGALAWVEIDYASEKRGLAESGGTRSPIPQSPGSGRIRRFMLNQDEGGAIQGPARVDFFAGHGPEAEQFAFHLWNSGKLYFLVQKKKQ